eukprot:jgi/Tetstr1/453925/TSEL_040844.t1
MNVAIWAVTVLAVAVSVCALCLMYPARAARREGFTPVAAIPSGAADPASGLHARDPRSAYARRIGTSFYGVPESMSEGAAGAPGGAGPHGGLVRTVTNGNTVTQTYEDGTVVVTTCTEETTSDGGIVRHCTQVIRAPNGDVTVVETTETCDASGTQCVTTITVTNPDGTTVQSTTPCTSAGHCTTTECTGDQALCESLQGSPPRPPEWVGGGPGGGTPPPGPACFPWATPDRTDEPGYAAHDDAAPCAFEPLVDTALPTPASQNSATVTTACASTCRDSPDCHGMLLDHAALTCTPYTISEGAGTYRSAPGKTAVRRLDTEPTSVANPRGGCTGWPSDKPPSAMEGDWSRYDHSRPCTYTAMGSEFTSFARADFVGDCRAACAGDNECDGVLIDGARCSMVRVADDVASFRHAQDVTLWMKHRARGAAGGPGEGGPGESGPGPGGTGPHNSDPSLCSPVDTVGATVPPIGRGMALFTDHEPCHYTTISFHGAGLVDPNYPGNVSEKTTLQITGPDNTLACVSMCKAKSDCQGIIVDPYHPDGGASCRMFAHTQGVPSSIMPVQGSRTVYVRPVPGLEHSLMGGRRNLAAGGVLASDEPHVKVWDQYDDVAHVERLFNGGFADDHDYTLVLHGACCSGQSTMLVGFVRNAEAVATVGQIPAADEMVQANEFRGVQFQFKSEMWERSAQLDTGIYDMLRVVLRDGRTVLTVAGPDADGRMVARSLTDSVTAPPGYVARVSGGSGGLALHLGAKFPPDIRDWHHGAITFAGFVEDDLFDSEGESLKREIGLNIAFAAVKRANNHTYTWEPGTMATDTIAWTGTPDAETGRVPIIERMRIPRWAPQFLAVTIVVSAGRTADSLVPLYRVTLDPPGVAAPDATAFELRNMFDHKCLTVDAAGEGFTMRSCMNLDSQMFHKVETSSGIRIRAVNDHSMCLGAGGDGSGAPVMSQCSADAATWTRTATGEDGTFTLSQARRGGGRLSLVTTAATGEGEGEAKGRVPALSADALADPPAQNQRWELHNPADDGGTLKSVRIVNAENDMCLDVLHGEDVSKLYVLSCHDQPSQRWVLDGGNGNKVQLRSMEDANMCAAVDPDSKAAVLRPCTDFTQLEVSHVAGGESFVLRSIAPAAHLDIGGDMSVRGTVGALIPERKGQQWRIFGEADERDDRPPAPGGAYWFIDPRSSTMIHWSEDGNLRRLVASEIDRSSARVWRLVPAGGPPYDRYWIVQHSNNLMLAVRNGFINDNRYSQVAGQTWTLTHADDPHSYWITHVDTGLMLHWTDSGMQLGPVQRDESKSLRFEPSPAALGTSRDARTDVLAVITYRGEHDGQVQNVSMVDEVTELVHRNERIDVKVEDGHAVYLWNRRTEPYIGDLPGRSGPFQEVQTREDQDWIAVERTVDSASGDVMALVRFLGGHAGETQVITELDTVIELRHRNEEAAVEVQQGFRAILWNRRTKPGLGAEGGRTVNGAMNFTIKDIDWIAINSTSVNVGDGVLAAITFESGDTQTISTANEVVSLLHQNETARIVLQEGHKIYLWNRRTKPEIGWTAGRSALLEGTQEGVRDMDWIAVLPGVSSPTEEVPVILTWEDGESQLVASTDEVLEIRYRNRAFSMQVLTGFAAYLWNRRTRPEMADSAGRSGPFGSEPNVRDRDWIAVERTSAEIGSGVLAVIRYKDTGEVQPVSRSNFVMALRRQNATVDVEVAEGYQLFMWNRRTQPQVDWSAGRSGPWGSVTDVKNMDFIALT